MSENATTGNGTIGKEATGRRKFSFGRAFRQYGTFCIFIMLILVAQAQSDAFLTERNIMNVLRQMSGIGVMAIGMLFVILTRGIDLSVGSVAALGSVATALLVKDYPLPVALAMVVGLGAFCGLISGIFIAVFRLPAFVITL